MKKIILILILCVFLTACASGDSQILPYEPYEPEEVAIDNYDEETADDIGYEVVYEYEVVAQNVSRPATQVVRDPVVAVPQNIKLVRLGELFTAEELQVLKSQAVMYQIVYAGIGHFARVVAIDPANGGEQQVFVTMRYVDWETEIIDIGYGRYMTKTTPIFDAGLNIYERISITAPLGTQSRLIHAGWSAGSGELGLIYKVTAEIEWFEYFIFSAGDERFHEDVWHATDIVADWGNPADWTTFY